MDKNQSLTDSFFAILNLLTQFTGNRGGVDNSVVVYGMGMILWGGCLVLSWTQASTLLRPKELLLRTGYVLAICREFFMLLMALLLALKLFSPTFLYEVFPPVEHLLIGIGLVVVEGSYIRYLVPDFNISRRFLWFGISFTAICYLASFWWWAEYIKANPDSLFSHTWCDWAFHLISSSLTLIAIIIIAMKSHGWLRNMLIAALCLFFVFQFGKIPDMVFHDKYEYILAPIGRLAYLIAIPLLGLIYLIEAYKNRTTQDELIWQQANYDTLTKLPNRQLFHDRLEQDAMKSHRTGMPLALLFIDLDRFKEVNDTLGHAKGDLLLVEAAQRISACVRETDNVARLGGDEFTIILTEFGEHTHLERIAQDIIQTLCKPFDLGNGHIAYVSASIGITLYPDDAHDLEELIKHADQAMYAAKAQGRNRFNYFTHAMQVTAQEKLRLTSDLRHALEHNQLEVYYQPIVNMESGAITKAEALLRWNHPSGMVNPMTFIPLAEESGLILDIGEWVFQQTIASIERWYKQFGRIIQVSVNKSPVQFEKAVSHPWMDKLASSGLPINSINVEITERLLIKNSAKVKLRLMEFRNRGIEVSIDDFGTGFSALSYLKQFDIDYLKIDHSFILTLTEDSSDKALVEAIIVMAHKLGIKTIAEGVETVAQRDQLAAYGCDYAQGFLYSRPVPAAEFEKLLASTIRNV